MSPSLSYFYPESITECQRFCVYLRKLNFLNLMETKTDFKSLGGESKLSDQLKNFSNLAKKARQEYIIEKLSQNVINIQNNDDWYFGWSILGALHHVKVHTERNPHRLYRGFMEEVNMEDIPIPIPVSIPVYKKFEENNSEISLYVYEWHNQNECLEFRYVSERRGDEYKQDLEMLTEKLISKKKMKGPDALERFVTKIEKELANIQKDLSVPAEMIMALRDLKVYNEVTECWICKGPFLKPAPEIVQKLKEAKHNLLEIKE
ncbi:hypothetical protein GLOIN_2v1882929 [Rhizophagus irregularis DAOM 181602=DAOM 197198]|uniref:Uncharacterized protein n=1 Tax=Rhizophagus irregularis (strain DAOM 181602 / DAOM 197198 / MUCL 43194) TaxID=747089 RepID=A0A2P4PAG4_RHIID|nr:hypothetical protein GLOIN_2v1882929 [Rhizophagus irregularis DAOM 181602=DAOM 197198]POG62392.1 hypothetical protein GLOIN_2v1882929 [Rhizophagus irregularis DAOM 181602=DAOM 197198]|eukprot:XP_025169258.1 hypothetical protein GLOIN_2v1882929 [Rhizophagus irregularis DAOM 181602=DAOM 197198]